VSERAQLKHVLLDVNFFSKAKVIELGEEFGEYGELAQLFLIKVLALMSSATDGKVSRVAARGCRGSIPKDIAEKVIEFCIHRQIFEDLNNGEITNSRVRDDQESLFKEQERWRKAKSKEKDPTVIPAGIPEEGARLSEDLKTEDLKTEDHKNNCQRVLQLPKSLDRPDVREAISSWASYRLKHHKVILDEMALSAINSTYIERPDDLIRDINKAVESAGEWRNLRDTSGFSKGRDSPRDFNAELVAEKKKKNREWAEKRDREEAEGRIKNA